ncbi:hypothetical protein PHLGIDRAFT_341106 [Phlebiopsis gigantea 11061_1 CR5-6]|uniref:Uncharacterized protein n=1 Tax=Phlebiopsis gigantea (strain 11061_1 CR5-6) TaxID=745531 RepID=A0A0C3RZ58_PHLG1|nr:hypothetical protein PHLGIDRAFT_341106 [Phlebiopsis gigantea 11061_1 CR5-6]
MVGYPSAELANCDRSDHIHAHVHHAVALHVQPPPGRPARARVQRRHGALSTPAFALSESRIIGKLGEDVGFGAESCAADEGDSPGASRADVSSHASRRAEAEGDVRHRGLILKIYPCSMGLRRRANVRYGWSNFGGWMPVCMRAVVGSTPMVLDVYLLDATLRSMSTRICSGSTMCWPSQWSQATAGAFRISSPSRPRTKPSNIAIGLLRPAGSLNRACPLVCTLVSPTHLVDRRLTSSYTLHRKTSYNPK